MEKFYNENPTLKDRIFQIEYHINTPMKPEQPVEPMYEVCPTVVTQFSGNPTTCWGASASVDFNFNRTKPSYRWVAVKTEDETIDSIITRSNLSESAPVEITILSKWDSSTKKVTGRVRATFDQAVTSADYTIGMLLVEDKITGPIPNYRQYSDFASPASYTDTYVFPDVLRGELLANDFWGKTGIIPTVPVVGSVYETTFSYTLPDKYYDIAPKPENMHFVAFVAKKTTTYPIASPSAPYILNCAKAEFTAQTDVVTDTEKPTVAVTSPTSATVLSVDKSTTIQWSASDNVGVTELKLEYTNNDGSTWNQIAASTANDGSEPWTPSSTGTYRVKVTAVDAASNSQSAESQSFVVNGSAGLDTSNLSVNLVKYAGWTADADSNGSTASMDTTAVETDERISSILTTVADVGENYSYTSLSGSFDKAFSSSTLFKLHYQSNQPVWFSLHQSPRADEGISFGFTLPKSSDTTIYIPLDSFKQPDWINSSTENLTLDLDSVSSFGFESVTIPGTTNFTLIELKATNYTIDSTAIVECAGKESAAIQLRGMHLSIDKSLSNSVVRIVNVAGRIVAERSIMEGSTLNLGALNLTTGAYIVQIIGKDFVSSAFRCIIK